MEFEFLARKNPWWKGKESFKEDPDYQKWKSKKIRWIPRIVNEIELKPFSLHFLFGPRQVGKTTALKLLIQKLLEKRDPKSIFYFRCESLKDYKELRELIEMYLEFREKEGIKSSVIILDEITAVEDWWRTIKDFIDDGTFSKDVIILTGSTSLKMRKQVELFPGRRGYGKNYVMLPLSFREFLSVVHPELYKKLDTKNVEKNIVYIRELNRALKEYFETGGFPLTINSYFEKGYIEESVKETYLSWIKNDLMKAGKEEKIAREILKVVLNKIPSPISWEGIAKETSIKSPKTVSSYLETFSDMYLLFITYFVDVYTGNIKFGKNKKINFLDPFLISLTEEWCMVSLKQKESVLAETVLASHLYRRFEEVYYWKNRLEIDTVVRKNSKLEGFECKWREKAKGIKISVGKMKEVTVVSRKSINKRVIPLSIFLLKF